MALQFNSNKINKAFWNSTKTTKLVSNQTFSGLAIPLPGGQTIYGPDGELITTYSWEIYFDTGIPYTEEHKLVAQNAGLAVATVRLLKGNNGNFEIKCSGTTTNPNGRISVSASLNGTYTSRTGELNRIIFDDTLVWKKTNYVLRSLEGSVWEFKETPVFSESVSFDVKFNTLGGTGAGFNKLNVYIGNTAIYLRGVLASGTWMNLYTYSLTSKTGDWHASTRKIRFDVSNTGEIPSNLKTFLNTYCTLVV